MSLRNHTRLVWVFGVLALLAAAVPAQALQLGSRETKEWIERLESPQRIAGLKVDEIIKSLSLRPGLVVADIGAGTGVFSRPFAKGVAPSGKVYSVDIDKGLLDYINERAQQEKITNIQTVLGKVDDPSIPKKDVDLVFIHDVLHHIKDRESYVKNLADYMKPNARLALIEMDKNDPNTAHKDQPEMLVTRAEVDYWMKKAGLYPLQEFDLFKGTKWFVVYLKGVGEEEDHMGH